MAHNRDMSSSTYTTQKRTTLAMAARRLVVLDRCVNEGHLANEDAGLVAPGPHAIGSNPWSTAIDEMADRGVIAETAHNVYAVADGAVSDWWRHVMQHDDTFVGVYDELREWLRGGPLLLDWSDQYVADAIKRTPAALAWVWQ